ncbi:MAG TPA: ApaG domain [Verrucomicrobiae bacterium]|nr:ApaG domain [Verrucomicrobiae bacterium]
MSDSPTAAMTQPASPPIVERPSVKVSIDAVTFLPDAEAPPDRPFAFRYDISIHNQGDEPVRIVGRKWIVVGPNGDKLVLDGDGVVGEYPVIQPGGRFAYHSFHVIDGDSDAEGAYYGLAPSGERFFTRIPRFHMSVADASDPFA